MTENEQEIAGRRNGAGRAGANGEGARRRLSEAEVALVRATLMSPRSREPTDEEVALFRRQIERTGLDPFARQIYAVYRYSRRRRREEISIEATIDGLRLIAERTGRYEGQTRTHWCGPDGEWRESWPDEEAPVAATVGVYKSGAREPTWGTAHFREYAEFWEDSGRAKGFYETMPRNQLAKCAEALALRKAFPAELSGLYAAEEMPTAQADAHADAPGDGRGVPEPSGLVAAAPRGGPAAPTQLRRALAKRAEGAGLGRETVARLGRFLYDVPGLDRLSEAAVGELDELVRAVGAGGLEESTLVEQLEKAERHADRARARALIAGWIQARARARGGGGAAVAATARPDGGGA